MKRLLIIFIRGYQLFLSPVMGSHCCFYPSCSQYSKEAIEKYGVFKGLALAFSRIFRCHPWSKGGYDPVPDKHKK